MHSAVAVRSVFKLRRIFDVGMSYSSIKVAEDCATAKPSALMLSWIVVYNREASGGSYRVRQSPNVCCIDVKAEGSHF